MQPPARRDPIVETWHGVAVADPYRWLEDGDSPEVRAWSAAQTEHTESCLAARPGFAALRARLAELLRVGSVEPPIVVGRRYFHRRQAPDRDQPALYVREGLDGADRVLVDPNTRTTNNTITLN